MFDTTFSYSSATPLPPNLSIDEAIKLLHDFETVVKLSPDCRGCKQLQKSGSNSNFSKSNGTTTYTDQSYEVEDDLPFIPKRLWSGGVKYNADFIPVADGCDITVYAPGGFTSTNHWRLLRETAPRGPSDNHPSSLGNDGIPETIPGERLSASLAPVQSKDLLHAETRSDGAGWYVEIISDAKCPKLYAGFVKGFLRNSHAQLQHAYIDRLKTSAQTISRPPTTRRPTLGRRRSSVL